MHSQVLREIPSSLPGALFQCLHYRSGKAESSLKPFYTDYQSTLSSGVSPITELMGL